MFTFFFPSFNKCNCADRVIDYLENEKYELKPIKFNKKQRKEAEKQYLLGIKSIENNNFVTDSKRIELKYLLLKNIFYKKVLKK